MQLTAIPNHQISVSCLSLKTTLIESVPFLLYLSTCLSEVSADLKENLLLMEIISCEELCQLTTDLAVLQKIMPISGNKKHLEREEFLP